MEQGEGNGVAEFHMLITVETGLLLEGRHMQFPITHIVATCPACTGTVRSQLVSQKYWISFAHHSQICPFCWYCYQAQVLLYTSLLREPSAALHCTALWPFLLNKAPIYRTDKQGALHLVSCPLRTGLTVGKIQHNT